MNGWFWLSDNARRAWLGLLIGMWHSELSWDSRMGIIYGTTILTKTNCYSIIWSSISTLTGKYDSFSGNRHLMNESLFFECINNSIESCEIHTRLSFFTYEFFSEIWEGNSRTLSKYFNKSFSWFCDTRFCHKLMIVIRNRKCVPYQKWDCNILKFSIIANVCAKKICIFQIHIVKYIYYFHWGDYCV